MDLDSRGSCSRKKPKYLHSVKQEWTSADSGGGGAVCEHGDTPGSGGESRRGACGCSRPGDWGTGPGDGEVYTRGKGGGVKEWEGGWADQ